MMGSDAYAVDRDNRPWSSHSLPPLYTSLGVDGTAQATVPATEQYLRYTDIQYAESDLQSQQPQHDGHNQLPPLRIDTAVRSQETYHGLPSAVEHLSPAYSQRSLDAHYPRARTAPSELSNDEASYAQLIWRALLAAPSQMLSLQEIYRWVETHSAKVRGRSKRSWQNSIRHNLSMNGAFKTVKHIDANGKVTSMWSLTPQAVASGVLSTTRYRKPSPRKGVKSAKQDKQRSAATTTANSSRHRRHAAAIPLLLPSPMEDYSSRPFTRQAEPPVLYDEVKGYGPCLGQGRLDTPPASHYNPSSGQFIAESEYECVIPSQEGSPVDPELKDFFTLAQSSYSWSPQHQ